MVVTLLYQQRNIKVSKVEETKKTDLELANEALAEIKPNVTAADRKECRRSEAMIIRYLNGQGTELDTAVELLKFFRERINARREVIGQR